MEKYNWLLVHEHDHGSAYGIFASDTNDEEELIDLETIAEILQIDYEYEREETLEVFVLPKPSDIHFIKAKDKR